MSEELSDDATLVWAALHKEGPRSIVEFVHDFSDPSLNSSRKTMSRRRVYRVCRELLRKKDSEVIAALQKDESGCVTVLFLNRHLKDTKSSMFRNNLYLPIHFFAEEIKIYQNSQGQSGVDVFDILARRSEWRMIKTPDKPHEGIAPLPKTCKECGLRMDNRSRYCSHCGTSVF